MFDRAASTADAFPYQSDPVFSGVLQFDEHGALPTDMTANIEISGSAAVTLDLSGMKQLAAPFSVIESQMDGGPPVRPVRIEINESGELNTVYEDGRRIASYRIPLGDVASPSQLTPVDGNAYSISARSGQLQLVSAAHDGYGKIISFALENSTVDIASELTSMIESQRNFTANSRVFQTSSELIDVLNRL